MEPMNGGVALRLADLTIGAARRALRVLPRGLVHNVEDRVFYVIFQRTRVENDAYGWRPDGPPLAGPSRANDAADAAG